MGRINLTFGGLAALLLLASANTASAGDEPKKSKKGDAAAKAAAAKTEEPAKTGSSWEADDKKTAAPGDAAATTATTATDAPPKDGDHWEHTDVYEAPEKAYWFIGARYRGTIVPKFMVNIFVNEGRTFYSNSIGIEADYRKDGFSLIPSLNYTEYGFGDTLFLEKNKPSDFPGNWSLVNSSLKGLYADIDILWSTKVSNNFDFEYGLDVGLGFIFGDLGINWLKKGGPYKASDGQSFSKCMSEGEGGRGSGCNKGDHSNSSVAKVNNYVEPSWADGGSRPILFPQLSIPHLGFRYKPVKEFQARVGLGFALTGPWFALSVDYGLEKKPKPKPEP